MARATALDLVRIMRTARPLFQQMASAVGCDCINGFGIARKRVAGTKTDQPAIVFYVSKKLSLRSLPVQNRIPKQFNIPWEHAEDGVLEIITDVQAVQFQALENTAKLRPCPGGFSIGHVDITAGTLGCLVKDKINDTTVILSNNHVLANSNQAGIGDPIVQPGPTDGGAAPGDTIGTLTRFQPIDFTAGANNLIDAAIATPGDPVADVVHEIKDVGVTIPTETRDITVDDLGDFVKKSGRTTEHTDGFVATVNATVQVKYGLGEKATFVDQIIIEAPIIEEDISAGGDSGSGVLDGNNNLIGLLFAGSEKDEAAGEPATAIISPIKHVFNLLDLETLTP
ncbi:MAG: hypothetical protein ACE5Q6_22390 [Dehalococcoidia bacterium]